MTFLAPFLTWAAEVSAGHEYVTDLHTHFSGAMFYQAQPQGLTLLNCGKRKYRERVIFCLIRVNTFALRQGRPVYGAAPHACTLSRLCNACPWCTPLCLSGRCKMGASLLHESPACRAEWMHVLHARLPRMLLMIHLVLHVRGLHSMQHFVTNLLPIF
jgi:hypothetical protein